MIFLDSSATTLQKPRNVAEAVYRAMGTAASPGRGSYQAAEQAAEVVYRCRKTAAELFHVPSPEQVVLTSNATHALNIALRSLLKKGGRVVISGYEHNAVTRTLASMQGVRVDVAHGSLFHPDELLESYKKLLPHADAAVCCHVSNVFGYILPLKEIASLCQEYGVPLVVDASQSAGVLPLDMTRLKAAYIAMPGHKGLYGPQGTGLLLCGETVMPQPLLTGGTGSSSLDLKMPDYLPDRLEAGTHNVCGTAGLTEGMRFVRKMTEKAICDHETALRQRAAAGLGKIKGVKVLESPDPRLQTGVLSFLCDRYDPEEVGQRLGAMGICVRAGYHCAPLAHESAGTLKTGTVRASFSAFNRVGEVDSFIKAVKRSVE